MNASRPTLWPALAATVLLTMPYGCRTDHKYSTPDTGNVNFTAMVADSATCTEETGTDTFLICVALAGDIMPGSTFPDSLYGSHLPSDNGKAIFAHATPILQQADAAFGNLETCLLDSGGTAKTFRDSTSYYVFRTPTSYVSWLTLAGFDALSIANNHTNDWGSAGRTSTRHTLTEAGLPYAGHTSVAESVRFRRNGITFGFCAFSTSPYTPDMHHTDKMRSIITSLRDSCDIVVVSFHGGGEGMAYRHVRDEEEEFLGFKRGNVVAFAHSCIDAGADVVFGHGPHLPRAMELYRDRLIAYSLGNFCTPYRISLTGAQGYAPLITARLDRKGRFTDGRIHSFIQHRGIGPVPDSLQRAAREIKELTDCDFPQSGLHILPDGSILRRSRQTYGQTPQAL